MIGVTNQVIADPHDQQITLAIQTVRIRTQIRRKRLHPGTAFRAFLPAIANHFATMASEVFATAPRTFTAEFSVEAQEPTPKST
jgi:hypothetical protein